MTTAVANMSAAQELRPPPAPGLFCSTSGGVIQDREGLQEHYKSDLHRYNLKRKVAGLPPVTKEWFEARKAQLSASHAASSLAAVPAGHVRVWYDPLTRKAFRTEQTYLAHTKSNKYQELVRKSQQPAPPPVISIRKVTDAADESGQANINRAAPNGAQVPQTPGYNVVKPSGGLPLKADEPQASDNAPAGLADEADGNDADSGWETASDEDIEEEEEGVAQLASDMARLGRSRNKDGQQQQQDEEDWEEWDLRRSLFDNHISKSFEANLEYMWRTYGFYLPDAQYLKDPEGLVKYLGAKLQYGLVPLYTAGSDSNAKQFRSLHAVQRHMVDSGRCKIVYEDNEEEYEDFYDYGDEEDEDSAQGKELALAASAQILSGGYELAVPGTAGGAGSGKVLGSREFARYYRQRHRPQDDRQVVVVNTMLAKYRSLGISLKDDAVSLEHKKLKTKSRKDQLWEGKRGNGLFMRNNINLNLPKNVPY